MTNIIEIAGGIVTNYDDDDDTTILDWDDLTDDRAYAEIILENINSGRWVIPDMEVIRIRDTIYEIWPILVPGPFYTVRDDVGDGFYTVVGSNTMVMCTFNRLHVDAQANAHAMALKFNQEM